MKAENAITKEINAKNENQVLTKVISSGHHLQLTGLTSQGKQSVRDMRRKQRTRKKTVLEQLMDKEKLRETGVKVKKS